MVEKSWCNIVEAAIF